jgi:hypothetical protein
LRFAIAIEVHHVALGNQISLPFALLALRMVFGYSTC